MTIVVAVTGLVSQWHSVTGVSRDGASAEFQAEWPLGDGMTTQPRLNPCSAELHQSCNLWLASQDPRWDRHECTHVTLCGECSFR